MGPQEASCRFTSGFTFAHCDYFRFLSIIIFAFPLDYRISCFRLRFIRFGLLDSYVFDLDFYILDFEFKIFDFEFKILDFDCKNRRLRLKYYCSYFCPQRNAIRLFVDFFKLLVLLEITLNHQTQYLKGIHNFDA